MTNGFFPVSTKVIRYFKATLPFDVYLERFEGKFTKIYHKDGEHDSTQIGRYEDKDINTLYISEIDKKYLEKRNIEQELKLIDSNKDYDDLKTDNKSSRLNIKRYISEFF